MEQTIETYGLVNIYYGTTGGNSRQLALEFSTDAKKHGFLPKVLSMGDFDPDEFMSAKFCAMFLSTYGTGGPTQDSERFYKWIEELASKKVPLFQNLNYILFGLGNSNFEFFAGMSKKVNAFLYELGAKQVSEFTVTDAKVQQPMQKFEEWRKNIFESIIKNHPTLFVKKTMSLDEIHKLNCGYEIKYLEKAPQDWQAKAIKQQNLRFEMRNYLQHVEVKVLQIREVRKNDDDSKRSTLFIRLERAGLELIPACDIQLYPENMIPQGKYKGGIELISEKQVPFPPMPLQKLMRLSNTSQKISRSFLQTVLLCSEDKEKVSKYEALMRDNEAWENLSLTCDDIIKEFNVGIEEQIILGVNAVRLYTLAGWNEKEIHLLVSLFVKNGELGLTSKYLASRPQTVRIKSIGSSFKLPEDSNKPIVMIANGSGMAPFLSFLHFYLEKKKKNQQVNPLFFYFGCQKLDCDFYFREEWQAAEKEGLVQLRIATSREGPKIYIQKLMLQHEEELQELLLTKQALFAICGSQKMGREVNNVFINILKKTGKSPYASLMKIKQLEKNGQIQKEIYG